MEVEEGQQKATGTKEAIFGFTTKWVTQANHVTLHHFVK